MAGERPISLFISSKMLELVEERKAVQTALAHYHMEGWLWEKDAGARPESVRKTYLKQVKACDLYIGLFWLGYGPYTIEEYHHARDNEKPCLIYEKHVDIVKRAPLLQSFLDGIGHVENDTGISICRFTTTDELVNQVREDVMREIANIIHKKNTPPDKPQRSNNQGNTVNIGRDNTGNINQYHIGRDKE